MTTDRDFTRTKHCVMGSKTTGVFYISFQVIQVTHVGDSQKLRPKLEVLVSGVKMKLITTVNLCLYLPFLLSDIRIFNIAYTIVQF